MVGINWGALMAWNRGGCGRWWALIGVQKCFLIVLQPFRKGLGDYLKRFKYGNAKTGTSLLDPWAMAGKGGSKQ